MRSRVEVAKKRTEKRVISGDVGQSCVPRIIVGVENTLAEEHKTGSDQSVRARAGV
jgi:hypothetical protein